MFCVQHGVLEEHRVKVRAIIRKALEQDDIKFLQAYKSLHQELADVSDFPASLSVGSLGSPRYAQLCSMLEAESAQCVRVCVCRVSLEDAADVIWGLGELVSNQEMES